MHSHRSSLALAPVVFLPLAAASPLSAQVPAAQAPAARAPEASPAPSVRGRVVDDEGAPIAGALVRAGGVARTSADGRFVLAPATAVRPPERAAGGATGAGGASGAGVVTLLVSAPGFASAAVTRPVGAEVTVTLRRLAQGLGAVQVTATPTARDPRAVTQSTTTVGEAELARSGGATLADALATQPGISVRSDGPGASMPIIRGLTGERLVVLHDGVRANDLAATAPDHGVTIDPLAMRRVEIVRGPAALLYGPNAVGGVVHVISDDVPLARPAHAERAMAVQGEGALPGVGFGADVTLPLGAGADDGASGWVLRARAGARTHGDQRLATGGRLGNTSLDARHGAFGLARVSSTGGAGIAYRGYDFAYGMPVVTTGDAPVRLDGRRHELLARAESRRGWGPFAGGRAEATAQWYAHRELVEGSEAMRLGATTQWGQAVARTRDSRWLKDGAVGVQGMLRRNGVDGALALTPPTRGGTGGAFLFQELTPFADVPRDAVGLRALRVPFGVRWDVTRVDADASPRFGPARMRRFAGVSGAAGLTLPLARGVSLGANLARAVRAPAAEELYSEAGHAGTGAFEVGDANLRTERTTGTDVVLRVQRARVTAQVAGYRNAVDGWVGLYPTGRDTIAPDGAGGTKALPLYRISQRDATLAGAEASVETVLAGVGATGGRGLVAGALVDVVRTRDALGAPLPFIPPARVGGHLRWHEGRREVGVRVRHALAQRRVPDGEFATGAYTLVDLHAAVPLPIAGRAAVLTVRVDNATDAAWRDAASRIKAFAPGIGRNVVVGVRTGW